MQLLLTLFHGESFIAIRDTTAATEYYEILRIL